MGIIQQPSHPQVLAMKPQPIFSPVSWRYIAALRGHKPKRAGTPFTYAEVTCRDPEKLICLAASNPEGLFYGFVESEAVRRTSEEMAGQHGTFNVIFLVGSPSETLARLANGSSLPPMLDFLCCDESLTALSQTERTALFELAGKRLNPGGHFVTSYKAYDTHRGSLCFLVRELVPEMSETQKLEFLTEIKELGVLHMAKDPELLARLHEAIAEKAPQKFFALFDGMPAISQTFDTLVGMGSRGLVYGGDALLAFNYVELAVPAEAQALIVKCRESLLYEIIKDFALARLVRTDIWLKTPCDLSSSQAELFGGFAYGLNVEHSQIPASFKAQGKIIDLSSPLYLKLTALMSIMPMGIGDFLNHPSGKNENPENVTEALKILVACGIVSPMRGLLTQTSGKDISQPRFAGNFNRQLDKADLTDKDVWLSSEVMGCGIKIAARDAFVMQALNRAGLNNSVSALLPELRRIAHTDIAVAIMDTQEPTPELAQHLVREVISKSLPQWYAYALLEAA